MNKQYIILLIISIASCNQKANDVEVNNNELKQKLEIIEKAIRTKERIEILPLKSRMTETEISQSHFVSDTITKDFNKLIGTTNKWSNIYPVMFPALYEGGLSGVFELNDSIRLISFFTDGDMEEQIFTKWQMFADSTLIYKGRLIPRLNSKYAFNTILDIVTIDNEEFFIGNTSGGEGGEVWHSLWTAKYNGKDNFDRIDHFETGYNDGENRKTIAYEFSDNELTILLKIDSVNYEIDTSYVRPISEVTVKTVTLE